MQNKPKGKSFKPYFIFLLFVCIPCIGFPVLGYFFPDKPIWTFLFFIFVEFMFLFWLIGQVLRAMAKAENAEQSAQAKKDLLRGGYDSEEDESHIKVLLAASSLLAVTSFFTTAAGMKQFVFSEGSVALAYLSSLAIQSILFVFGKNLLRFSFSIRYANWPEVLRKILIRGEIIFFCLCLLASSIFSWVFISNNAYKSTRFSDGEAAVLRFLTDETANLMAENQRQRENALSDLVNNINFKINPIIVNNLTTSQAAAIDSIQRYADAFSPSAYEIPAIEAVNAQIGNLLSLAANDIADLEVARASIEANVSSVYNRFKNHDTQYNEIMGRLNSLKQNDIDTFDFQQWAGTIAEDIATCEDIDNDIETNFDNAILNAVGVNGFRVDGNSIVGYLASFHTLAGNAKSLRGTLENIQTALRSASSSAEGSTGATAPGSGTTMSVNEIINQIFLLPTQDNPQSKAKELIEQLTNLLRSSSDGNTDDTREIVLVTQKLQKYADHLDLQNLLDTFKRQRLGHTYYIYDPKKDDTDPTDTTAESTEPTAEPTEITTDATEPNSTALAESNGHAAITVTSDQWKNERTQDMLDFISYLSLLPNSVTDASNSSDAPNPSSPSDAPTAAASLDTYTPSTVLQEAINLQRRHLGNLTELESAFNYLTSDYPVMSYFSAALALFLDLTAFLTGCLLFFLNILRSPKRKEGELPNPPAEPK